MTLRFLMVVVLLSAPASALSTAADAARDPYLAALAQERLVRAAMNAADPPPATVDQVRDVITAYRNVVKQHPASGYSDNALWQAGRLAVDAFLRFGEPRDKNTGIRLLTALTSTYPTSKLVKQVPEQLARLDAAVPAPRIAPDVVSAVSPSPQVATIKSIRRTVVPGGTRIVIELDAEVSFHDERLNDPARVFIDLASTRAVPELRDRTLRFDGDVEVVHQVRVGRRPNNMTRIVVDALGVASYGLFPLYDPYRIVIDCVRGPAPPPSVLASHSPTMPEILRRPPIAFPQAAAALADARAARVRPAPLSTHEAATIATMLPALPAASASPTLPATATTATAGATVSPPTKNSSGGFSMARQLGLGVSRIVIDPGHGGHDPGAQGKGIDEAELVLDVALRLEKLLQKVPGVDVLLTRRSDEFVPLQERTAIANREGADLFLSIHANASANPEARGIETYFLNFANSMSAAAVAARENAASGQSMGALPDFVKAIALNNKLDESRDFAAAVQRSMLDRLRVADKAVKNLGVKQAPFVVLIGAAMPSVLAEISFVTNPQDVRLLKGNAYRQRIAEALYGAIRRYQNALRVQTVAHQ